jgi:hypothetical protein
MTLFFNVCCGLVRPKLLIKPSGLLWLFHFVPSCCGRPPPFSQLQGTHYLTHSLHAGWNNQNTNSHLHFQYYFSVLSLLFLVPLSISHFHSLALCLSCPLVEESSLTCPDTVWDHPLTTPVASHQMLLLSQSAGTWESGHCIIYICDVHVYHNNSLVYSLLIISYSLALFILHVFFCRTKRIFKSCSAVCFDVDSTVIREEGVDVLAAFSECGDEVAGEHSDCME